MFLETVDSLSDATEEQISLVRSLRQSLESQDNEYTDDTDIVFEEGVQYVIVTDAQYPVAGVSVK